MLTLYQFPAPWDVCSASCFCAKVEAFMRWQGIAHDVVSKVSLKRAPKGKVPFIEDENGVLGDSDFIIAYLCRKHQLQPDAGLTAEQKGVARAIHYLCEEGLYRLTTYYRFVEPQGWEIMRNAFLSGVPAWLRPVAAWKVQAYVKNQLKQQGIGRHTPEEIAGIARKDLDALSAMLGDKPYFFGEMSLADVQVFSLMSNFLTGPFDNAAMRHARSLPNLVAHTQRVREQCFGAALPMKDAA